MRQLILPGLAAVVLLVVVLLALFQARVPEVVRVRRSAQERQTVKEAAIADAATSPVDVDAPSAAVASVRQPVEGPDRGALTVMCTRAASGGLGLAGVEVSIRSTDKTVIAQGVSDDHGEVRFEAVPFGQHRIEMRHESWLPVESNVHPSCRVLVPGVPVRVKWSQALACAFELRGELVDARIPSSSVGRSRFLDQGPELRRMYETLYQRLVPNRRPEQRRTHVVRLLHSADVESGAVGEQAATVRVIGFHPEFGPCGFDVPVRPVDEVLALTVLDGGGVRIAAERMSHVTLETLSPVGLPVDAGEVDLIRDDMRERYGFMSTRVKANGDAWLVAGTYRVMPVGAWVRAREPKITLSPGDDVTVRLQCECDLAEVEIRITGMSAPRCVLQVELQGRKFTPPRIVASGDRLLLPVGRNKIVLTIAAREQAFGPGGSGLEEVVRWVVVEGDVAAPQQIVLDVRP